MIDVILTIYRHHNLYPCPFLVLSVFLQVGDCGSVHHFPPVFFAIVVQSRFSPLSSISPLASSWSASTVGDVYKYLSPRSSLMSVLSPDHVIKTLELIGHWSSFIFFTERNEPIIVHKLIFFPKIVIFCLSAA